MQHTNELSVPIGNIDLLNKSKTAFLSSRRTPDACRPKIVEWVESLSPASDCVMVGCLQPLEDFVLQMLLERDIPTVLVLSTLYPSRFPLQQVVAIGDGRLLVISIVDGHNKSVSKGELAAQRNKWMISNADKIVVGALRTSGGFLADQLDAVAGPDVDVVLLNEFSEDF